MMFLLPYLISGVHSEECTPAESHEELQVYVLTSGPGNSPYTRVGHTALWVSGGGKRETVFNWGAYDSSQNNFLWHFFMGDAEYKLAMMSRPYNLRRVKQNEQKLVAQHLNLTENMALSMAAELARLAHPDNHSYTYHWEHQNCSTLIRDLIEDVTEGSLSQVQFRDEPTTRRFEVLRHLEGSGWPWFGWHFMASDYGDRIYTSWDAMHLPKKLYDGLQIATININEHTQPLVDHECELNLGTWAKTTPSQDWWKFLGVGTFLGGLSIVISYRKSTLIRTCLGLWYGLSGILSSFFVGCWIFSSLEGYGFNENWFLSNPVHLLIPWILWKKVTPTWYLWIWMSLLIAGGLWKFLDSTPQENIEWVCLFGASNLGMMYVLWKTKDKLKSRRPE